MVQNRPPAAATNVDVATASKANANADANAQPPSTTTAQRTVTTVTRPVRTLKFQIFNPGGDGVFPVASTIISGDTEMALIDSQFQTNHAAELVKLLKATGKQLRLVYISHSDPDFYFGNEVIKAAFPDCPFYATGEVIDAIQKTYALKLSHWSPALKENAPKTVVVPQKLPQNFFTVDGERVEIRGPTPSRTYGWIPSAQTVLGGPAVFGTNVHLWLADTPTLESRAEWSRTLATIEQLRPELVVPSHFFPGSALTADAVDFTRRYLTAVEQELPTTKDSTEFIAAMKRRYPNLESVYDLELGAKVVKGEMKWH